MHRPRSTAEHSEKVKKEVLSRLVRQNTKTIAFELGYSESRVRAIAWNEGWRSVFLSPKEQAIINKNRAA